jgi:hypothetical protein
MMARQSIKFWTAVAAALFVALIIAPLWLALYVAGALHQYARCVIRYARCVIAALLR